MVPDISRHFPTVGSRRKMSETLLKIVSDGHIFPWNITLRKYLHQKKDFNHKCNLKAKRRPQLIQPLDILRVFLKTCQKSCARWIFVQWRWWQMKGFSFYRSEGLSSPFLFWFPILGELKGSLWFSRLLTLPFTEWGVGGWLTQKIKVYNRVSAKKNEKWRKDILGRQIFENSIEFHWIYDV